MIKGTSVSSLKTKKNASKNKVKKHTKKPVPHIQAETLLQAAELSKAFKNMARYPYRATAILTGYPKIRPFDPISVTDLPDESLNGVWVVLSVKHQFNVSGAAAYQMEFFLTKYAFNLEIRPRREGRRRHKAAST
jgi:phage protein D